MFSLIEKLFTDPLWFFEFSLYRIPAVLIALVLHEWAHGYVAFRRGDPTAQMMGRLTLNPLKHLDPLGAFFLFFMGFGWAKPVPVNPNNFRNPRRDDLMVSLAGVTVNFLIFVVSTLVLVFVSRLLWMPDVVELIPLREYAGFRAMDDGFFYHIFSGTGPAFSVLQVILYGDGSVFSILFARPELLWVVRLVAQISLINIGIAVFNLLPVPPLDGYHVLNDLVLKGDLFASGQAARIGMGALYLLMFTGLLGRIMTVIIDAIQGGLLGAISLVLGG